MDNFTSNFVATNFLEEQIDASNLIQDAIIFNEFFSSDIEQQLVSEQSGIPGNIPCREDFAGRFNFRLGFDESESGQQWVYSRYLQQLFIGMNKKLVIQFQMDWNDVASAVYVRALPVYSTDEHVNVPVDRCTFHSVEDDPQRKAHQQEEICLCGPENKFVGHVVRAGGEDVQYKFDSRSRRHSVRVLLTPPKPGTDYTPIQYSFACKTSCPKGMQRRPIYVIFTLEDESGTVIGRQKIGVKICSCPKRDKKRHEDDYSNEKPRGDKKRKLTSEETQPIVIPEPFTQTYIKNEDTEPQFFQKLEREAEFKQQVLELKKLIDVAKEVVSRCEYSLSRLTQLSEGL